MLLSQVNRFFIKNCRAGVFRTMYSLEKFPSFMDTLSFICFCTGFFVFLKFSNATNAITLSESLSDGSTLVSADRSFELGFFTPGSSSSRYVGLWYKNIPARTVVWVANRENPINDSSGSLMIDSRGNLALVGKNNVVFWSTNTTKQAQIPVVELLDSGNLVIRDMEDGSVENYLWQSFDYPTDTLIPGMKAGINLKTGFVRRLLAWKNWDDPSPGYFFANMQPHNIPEPTIWKGPSIFYRSPPLVGISYRGSSQVRENPSYSSQYVHNEEEIYHITYQKSKYLMTRLVMNQTNNRLERFTWNNDTQSWTLYAFQPADYCDTYTLCGANGICISSNFPACKCLTGFKPKFEEYWNSATWSQGCVRNKPLNCYGDGFIKFSGLKLPDATHTWVYKRMDRKQCGAKCLENCSCTAYSTFDVEHGGSGGCAIWFNDLLDIRQMSSGDVLAQDLFVRVSASESDELGSAKTALGKKKILVITVTVIVVVSGALISGYYLHRRVKEKNNDHEEDMELPLFDLESISNATNRFALTNKLGQGGFGPVYKGTLLNGQEIAVKRLSRNSGQGVKEFKNEVTLIAKLQHRNLVKLLGCCIHGQERLLIYEYMPNKSLDSFIFDQNRGKLLDWSKRFNIICGIARGLLYLHQDSRLRIVHRDLKTGNVLLDNEMNPKISDFGMAAFIGDQTEGNTNRVVGTYGYMAPEYAADGLFSVKSDVFSFGIIMLELISGKKSRGFYHHNCANLIAYAWRQWKEGHHLELIDSFVRESSDLKEVARCIHVGLLCVQHHAGDRPSMASVILMLSSENHTLPQPKEPGFFNDKFPSPVASPSNEIASPTEITMSLLEPR